MLISRLTAWLNGMRVQLMFGLGIFRAFFGTRLPLTYFWATSAFSALAGWFDCCDFGWSSVVFDWSIVGEDYFLIVVYHEPSTSLEPMPTGLAKSRAGHWRTRGGRDLGCFKLGLSIPQH
jgi:hypothetical protein